MPPHTQHRQFVAGKKMAALCGAAKFREETSKKAGWQSRLAAMQHGARFCHVNPLRPIAHGDVPERLAAPGT
jgi:hypothetical protein